MTIQRGNYFCTGMSSVFLVFFFSRYFCLAFVSRNLREIVESEEEDEKSPLGKTWLHAEFSLQLVISEALPALTVLFQGGIRIISSGLFLLSLIHHSFFFSSDNVVRFRGFITFVMHAKNYSDLCV